MQRRLGDQRCVVVHAKHLGVGKSTNNKRDGLQLRARLRDTVFVHAECLHIKVVCKVFEAAFVGDLGGEKEEAEGDGRCFNLGGKDGSELAHELEDGGHFGLPFGFDMFPDLVAAAEFDGRGDEGGEGEAHSFTAHVEVSSCSL